MSTPTLIGVADHGSAYTARSLRHGAHPDTLVSLLRRVWAHTFGRDTAAMATALLAHDWDALAISPRPSRTSRRPVAGLGYPAPTGDPAPRQGRLGEDLDGYLEWLYLLHTDHQVVLVYEATRHARWLRHSLHHLDPVADLFVTEPDPHDRTTPAMTVCTVCGAVDETECHELPSVAGYGRGTVIRCQRCGSSATTDPMFGTRITRSPWPPAAGSARTAGNATGHSARRFLSHRVQSADLAGCTRGARSFATHGRQPR